MSGARVWSWPPFGLTPAPSLILKPRKHRLCPLCLMPFSTCQEHTHTGGLTSPAPAAGAKPLSSALWRSVAETSVYPH